MNEIPSNELLLSKKLRELDKLKKEINLATASHSLSCIYHGINLNFRTHSFQFINSLQSFIPVNWISEPKNEVTIYLFSPQDFGFSMEEWSDEYSQDCFSYENNSTVVQRDFAACKNGNSVYLICEDLVSDGFYNFLRWYISEQLMDINKYVLHASCVLDKNNKAHLFLGHSGAGKTTITKLSSPRLVLGDDMNLASLENNQLFIEAGAIGGQFNSMIGYDRKMPVKACYWLKQANENRSVKLDAIIANQKLLASFANLHWPTLAQSKIDQLMDFANQAVSGTNFYELHFMKSDSIWEYLDP